MEDVDKIFLIYVDEDNKVKVHDEKGWIDAFKHFLKVVLKQIAGWNIAFERINTIKDFRLWTSKDLILIISSNNLINNSDTLLLLNGLKERVNKEEINGDRILKIQKHYFPKDIEPDFLHHYKDYSFFKANGLSESRSEYKDFFSTNEEKTYWVKLTDLAYEIFNFSSKKVSGHLDITNYCVFLAETNADSEKYRNNLKRDLQSMGLNIKPDNLISDNANDFIIKLDENVKKTDFAIHIIGTGFGNAIAGINHTKEEIQAKITENFSNLYKKDHHGRNYYRFFWFDKSGLISNEKMNNFYKELSVKVEDLPNTELVVSSWEEFKSLVYQFISFELPNLSSQDLVSEEDKIVYFLYDKSDEKKALKYIQKLRDNGFKVITSNFDGDILAVRHIHMESLKRFDYAIIFAENASLQWVNMKLLDVFKAPGFGREKPILKKMLVLPQNFEGDLIPAYKMFEVLRYETNPEKEILNKLLF